MEFEEVGPGNVLTQLITPIQKDAEPLIVAEEKDSVTDQAWQEQETDKIGVKLMEETADLLRQRFEEISLLSTK